MNWESEQQEFGVDRDKYLAQIVLRTILCENNLHCKIDDAGFLSRQR